MNAVWISMLILAADDVPPAPRSLEARLQEVNLEEARHWQMHLDEGQQTKAELIERPVYVWTNPTKGGGQHGAVFVWVYAGQPIVVGTFFGHPTGGRRRLTHEFHSLSQGALYPECSDGDGQLWRPQAPIKLKTLPEAPAPEASPARRLLQMRALAREFGGHTVDWRKQRWELRLLPQPLYRYDKPQGEVIDGALMALVTDAGTDPEVLVLLEARREGGWRYALLRFSDSSLWATHRGQEVWTAVRDTQNVQNHNADHTYQVFQKRFLDESFNNTENPQP